MAPGIDRAPLHVYNVAGGHSPLPIQDENSKSHTEYVDDKLNKLEAGNPQTLGHVTHRSKVTQLKLKARKIFGISHRSGIEHHEPSKALTLAPKPKSASSSNERLIQEVPPREKVPVKEMIRNPIETVQSVARGSGGEQFAVSVQQSAIPHSADVALVKAHDRIEETSEEDEKGQAIRDMDELVESRQDHFVRWTMDRHLLELRSFPAKTVPWKTRKDFVVIDDNGRTRMDWVGYGRHLLSFCAERYGGQYLGASSVRPAASEEAINASIERLLLTSTPVQEALLRVRDIYRWKDPTKTARYLSIYFLLWMSDYIASFVVLSVILFVMKRRYYPPTFEDFRDDVERSEDEMKTAHNLAQLIERHGPRGWIDALLADGGPGMMMQLEDAANCLERAQNFTSWRSPFHTTYTLIILTIVLLFVTFAPLYVLSKTGLFFAGVIFFGLFPISSRYPQYRLLASPLTWLFWGIPTNTDWAIARIQAEASHNIETMQHTAIDEKIDSADEGGVIEQPVASLTEAEEQVPDTGGDAEVPPPPRPHTFSFIIGAYRCMYNHHFGKLHISSSGISFTTSVRSHDLWSMRYDQLKKMTKSEGKAPPAYGKGLVFVHIDDDTEFEVYGLKARDEVFTQIIGYSGIKWLSIW